MLLCLTPSPAGLLNCGDVQIHLALGGNQEMYVSWVRLHLQVTVLAPQARV